MLETIRSIAAYVIDLGILIFFHELGHFLAARSQGVVVETFSIGFGPALLSWRSRAGTVWQLSALPLGGYVKMQGWGMPADDEPVLPGSFSAASLPSKALIVAAGPAANVLLAFLIFAGLFMTVGRDVMQPVLSTVVAGSPAARGGLQAGDRVTAIDGVPIATFNQMQDLIVAHPGGTLTFTVARHGAPVTDQVTLGSAEAGGGKKIGHLGVGGDDYVAQHFSPPAAIAAAGQETWNDSAEMLTGLWNLAVHHIGVDQLAGPLGIAQITGKVAAQGVVSIISLVALLSINIGLINLVPIPILDGGHLLFYAAEAIYRRPIPARAMEVGMRAGLAIILTLVVVTTFNDLTRMGAVTWVAHLFG
jgi:regulator of sigma E protease